MQYGALLSRAWRIIWRNKIMWLFGFLAALGSGGGGGGGGGGSSPNANLNVPSPGQPGRGGLPPELQRQLTALLSNQAVIIAIVVGFILLVLVITLVIALIAAFGHGALVEMAREADDTEKTRFGTGWRAGLRRVFPVFLIRFLLGLPPFLIIMAGLAAFLLSFIPLITRSGFRGAPEASFVWGVVATMFLCFVPACCVGVLLTIPLNVLETLSIRALVLEERGIFGSIRRGWQVLTGNLGEVAVVWLIFLLIGIVVFIVVGLPLTAVALIVIVPLVFLLVASPIFIVPLLLVVILLGLVDVVLRGIVETYASTVWTLAYRQLAARPALAPAMV
jgi:hypothetical protein